MDGGWRTGDLFLGECLISTEYIHRGREAGREERGLGSANVYSTLLAYLSSSLLPFRDDRLRKGSPLNDAYHT